MPLSIKERLIEYLTVKQISKSEFGRRVGVSNAYITSIRKSIQPEKIQAIQREFPDLNIEWLISGVGSMLVDTTSTNSTSVVNTSASSDTSVADLTARFIALLERKDAQIERLIALLENLRNN